MCPAPKLMGLWVYTSAAEERYCTVGPTVVSTIVRTSPHCTRIMSAPDWKNACEGRGDHSTINLRLVRLFHSRRIGFIQLHSPFIILDGSRCIDLPTDAKNYLVPISD